jgi:hypothetical protein
MEGFIHATNNACSKTDLEEICRMVVLPCLETTRQLGYHPREQYCPNIGTVLAVTVLEVLSLDV